MPIALSDVLELMNALGDLHEQADARLAGPVSGYELTIHGILRRLRVARDLERNAVFRGCSEIVAD